MQRRTETMRPLTSVRGNSPYEDLSALANLIMLQEAMLG
jgi:hypothetical protein